MRSLFAVLRSLVIPAGGPIDDAGLVLLGGTDLPLCMQNIGVKAAILWRPNGSVSTDSPYFFIGIHTGSPVGVSLVSYGALVWDQAAGLCGTAIYRTELLTRTGTADLTVNLAVGKLNTSGSGAFTVTDVVESFDHYTAQYGSTCTINNNGAWDQLGSFSFNGVQLPRGRADFIANTGNTGAIGAETVTLTGGSVLWQTGRAYEVTFAGEPLGSVANNTAIYQLRRTNLAGAVKYSAAFQMSPTAGFTTHVHGRAILRNATGSNITDNLVLTLQATAGTVTDTAAATFPRYMEVTDIGASADYANATQI